MPDLARRPARASALALLGGIAVLCAAGPAPANGCQVRDRPALPVALLYDAPGDPALPPALRPAPRLAPRPCTGDVPSAPERPVPDASVAASARVALLPAPGARRPDPPPAGLSPLDRPSRLDRPPRPAPR